MKRMGCQADLSQIVSAGRGAGGLASLLNGGEEEAHEPGDDRHDDEHFHQGESEPRRA